MLAATSSVVVLDVRCAHCQERRAFQHRVAFRHQDLDNVAACRGLDDVLHLHGFHHHDLLASTHDVARAHIDADDRALHRRSEHGAVRSSACCHVGSVGRRTRLLAVMQDRERIARVDTGTRQRSLRSRTRRRLRKQPRMPAVAGSKLARVPLDECGIDVVRFHCRIAQQVLQEADVRRDAFDAELAQRAIRPLHDVGEVVR